MPAFSTHYIFAKEMEEHFCNKKIDMSAIYIGTQGPDIFFFHRAFPWLIGKSLSHVASAVHRSNPAVIFDSLAKYCNNSHNKIIAKSYAYGFILHYALDRICHPFVYYMQGIISKKEHINPHSAHNLIEMTMDSYYINKRLHLDNPYDFKTHKTITTDKGIINEISQEISDFVNNTIEYKIDDNDVQTAINDTIYCQRIFSDKFQMAMILGSTADKIIAPFTKNFKTIALLRPKSLENAEFYGNIDNSVWHSPYDKTHKRCESFEDLFELAKSDALKLIQGFEEICVGIKTGKEVTQNISFLTGVKV